MNQRENFTSAVNREKHDYTPVFLFDLTLGMEVAGYPTSEVYRNGFDGAKSAKSILALQSLLGTDAVVGSVHSVDSRGLGSKMFFPDDKPPYTEKQPFSDPEELYKHSPSEVSEASTDQMIVSHNYIREKKPDIGLLFHVPAPLSIAMIFRGIEKFFMDTLSEPEYADDELKFASESVGLIMEKIIPKIDADAVLFSGAYDNIDLLGLEPTERLSLKTLKPKIDLTHSYGLPVVFHPHGVLSAGDGETILDEMLDIGTDCLYYGENNDPRILLKHTKGKASIMGGIDTFTTIFLGPNERVKNDTLNCIKMFENEDYIFTCSCSVDRGLPLDHIKTMVDTVRSS